MSGLNALYYGTDYTNADYAPSVQNLEDATELNTLNFEKIETQDSEIDAQTTELNDNAIEILGLIEQVNETTLPSSSSRYNNYYYEVNLNQVMTNGVDSYQIFTISPIDLPEGVYFFTYSYYVSGFVDGVTTQLVTNGNVAETRIQNFNGENAIYTITGNIILNKANTNLGAILALRTTTNMTGDGLLFGDVNYPIIFSMTYLTPT